MSVSFHGLASSFSEASGSQVDDANLSRLKSGSKRAFGLARSRSSYSLRWNRDLTAALTQLTNEKLPTDVDRATTGGQPFKLASVSSSRAFKLAASPYELNSTLLTLFAVLVKR